MSTLLTAEKEIEGGQDECGRNQESMPDVTNSSGKSQPGYDTNCTKSVVLSFSRSAAVVMYTFITR